MTNLAVILAVIAGALLGGVFAALLARSKIAALAERRNVLEQDLSSTRNTAEQQTAEIKLLSEARAALNATLESERRNAEEKLRLLAEASEELKTQFKVLAAAALESNNSNFLQLAQTTLQNYQPQAPRELAQKEQAVKNLVDPIAQSLAEMSQQIHGLEQARSEAYGPLTTQVASLLDTQKALQAETGNLVKAMREPQARGRWGELQLRRCLELAGAMDHCGFRGEVVVSSDERQVRPDVVIQLPGEKNIVVDAKAPLAAYLGALEAPDEATRKERLADHARQVRQHIESLSSKSYWNQFEPTPEFVVLFLPGEVFFRAAMDADPDLIEYGVSRKVIVASPTTLIALLRAVAYGWNQKNLAESARKISDAGKTLYQRLSAMARNFEDIGKRLGGAVEAYNKAVGSMERSVFPIARKLPELDGALAADALPDLQQVEKRRGN